MEMTNVLHEIRIQYGLFEDESVGIAVQEVDGPIPRVMMSGMLAECWAAMLASDLEDDISDGGGWGE